MTVLIITTPDGYKKTFDGNKKLQEALEKDHTGRDPLSELVVGQQVKSKSVIQIKHGKMLHLVTISTSIRRQGAQYLHPPTNSR